METMENEQNYKGFAAIRDKAVEIGMPKYWATDLGIDAMSLWEHKDTPFIWIPRECGTALVLLDETNKTIQDCGLGIVDYYRTQEETARFFYWDGDRLTEKTGDEAYDITATAFSAIAG